MALVVQKYGGTSMGSIERIRNVAKRVAKTYDEGNDLVVVVSAMSGETNKLVALATEMCEFPSEREYDVMVATGEQVSMSLLAMALQSMGYKAKSYCGFQLPIITDSAFSKARIEEIDDKKVREDLKNGVIVVVAGFQGIDRQGNLTTLGRGGSDTSARELSRKPQSWKRSLTTKCWRWLLSVPRSCRFARSSLPRNMTSLFMSVRVLMTIQGPW